MKIEKIYELNQTIAMKRKTIYNLWENEIESQTVYGIEIVVFSNNKQESSKIENISRDKNQVINIITLLYENAVGISHFKDVVEDYISSL